MDTRTLAFALLFVFACASNLHAALFDTATVVAGDGTLGFSGDGGAATAAQLAGPQGITTDNSGNIYFADTGNNRVRRIDPSTGVITTIAGNGAPPTGGPNNPVRDGPATDTPLRIPLEVEFDGADRVYLGSFSNPVGVHAIDLSTGLISRFAGGSDVFPELLNRPVDGGPATAGRLFGGLLAGTLAVHPNGDVLITQGVTGDFSSSIRNVNPTTGVINTVAGSPTPVGNPPNPSMNLGTGNGGLATDANFAFTSSVAADSAGNLFILDEDNPGGGTIFIPQIRRVDATTGVIDAFAGGGAETLPGGDPLDFNFNQGRLGVYPDVLTVDNQDRLLIGAQRSLYRIDNGVVELLADTSVLSPGSSQPTVIADVTVAPDDTIYVTDRANHRVLRLGLSIPEPTGAALLALGWFSQACRRR